MASGWIKLHRKMLNNPIVMKDSDHLALWIYLLSNATHDVHISIFNGKKRKILPGELITGRSKIALALQLSESKVERILSLFKSEQMIRQVTSAKSRLVSIVKWQDYQITEQVPERKVNNNRTTSEQQPDTIQEYKELKNVKEDIPHRQKILDDAGFIATIGMTWKIQGEELLAMIQAFELQLAADGKNHKEFSAYKSHFHNWGVKKFTEFRGSLTTGKMNY